MFAMPHTDIAKFLWLIGNAPNINVWDKGGRGAAKAPCKNLATTISSREDEYPQ